MSLSRTNSTQRIRADGAGLGIPKSIDCCFERYEAALQKILKAAEMPFRTLGIKTTNEIAQTTSVPLTFSQSQLTV